MFRGHQLICFLVAWIVLWGTANAAMPSEAFTLGTGTGRLTLDANGVLAHWADEPASAETSSAGEIHYAGKILKLMRPAVIVSGRGSVSFHYSWVEEPGLEVTIEHRLTKQGRARTWTREVQIKSASKLTSDLTVYLDTGVTTLSPDAWLPRINGVGAVAGTNRAAVYRFAGILPEHGASLALPMISVPAPKGRVMIATDPYFSTLFTPTTIAWTYPAQGGLENGLQKRTIFISRHEGSPDQSLNCFFRTVLPDVPPGPKWLHDIAMVDYDYMSDGGRGWYRDIDALAAAVPNADRHQVLFCLHGWYDFLGRYCFDSNTKKFDKAWTVFSSYEAAQKAPMWGTIGGERVNVGFANCKPLAMSLKEVHARLKYARERGFRVGIYFADGMNAGDGLPGFDPACVLEWGGWPGADVKGRSYVQNPLQPKVRAFYLDYARALLEEFGPDIDMLNWDETFHIPAGKLGNDAAPGYADRAMMRLARDLTLMVDDYNHAHRRQIAFLTSDCLGAVYGPKDKAPYALMAHGTYQDSWCQPQAWSHGIFPNYRNVLWSLCWWPMTKWDWIDFGVRHYQAAVSLSNGWGDDRGFSEMTDAQRARAMALFKWRKDKPTMLKWFEELPEFKKRNGNQGE
jgi:hypothetical protein